MVLSIRLELGRCGNASSCRYLFCPLRRGSAVSVIDILGMGTVCRRLERMVVEYLGLEGDDVASLREFLRGNARSVGWIARLVDRVGRAAGRENVSPPSWGQEVEVSDRAVSAFFREVSREVLGGGYDGSGPWEFRLGPFHISEFPYDFFDLAARRGFFEWRPQGGEMGCHVHYRPAAEGDAAAWAYAFANCYTLSVLLSKLLCHFDYGERWRFRWRLLDWAGIEVRGYLMALDYIEGRDGGVEVVRGALKRRRGAGGGEALERGVGVWR